MTNPFKTLSFRYICGLQSIVGNKKVLILISKPTAAQWACRELNKKQLLSAR
jgi:hypothetical protein